MFPKERYTKVKYVSQPNLFRLYGLRGELEREIDGVKGKPPTAYIRIKREFNLTGNRKSVLRQFSYLIERMRDEMNSP